MHPWARQLTALLDLSLDFARQLIEEQGTFYPFGAALDAELTPQMLAGSNGEDQPDPGALYRLLEDAATAAIAEGSYRAVAITADVTIPEAYAPPFPDGIRVYVEAPAFCRFVYLPYRRAGGAPAPGGVAAPPEVEYGEVIAVELPNRLFGEQLPS
jgi:hypothetical protein